MKTQLKRRFFILLASLLLVSGISVLVNRASFDPDFSVVDALSSATKHSRRNKSETDTETVIAWSYLKEDLALPDEAAYEEETIEVDGSRYVLLKKTHQPETGQSENNQPEADQPKADQMETDQSADNRSADTLVILSDKDNSDYLAAVGQVAEYYENLGYTVEIRECSEFMMLSLAHAEHFDLFLLREEEAT